MAKVRVEFTVAGRNNNKELQVELEYAEACDAFGTCSLYGNNNKELQARSLMLLLPFAEASPSLWRNNNKELQGERWVAFRRNVQS